VEGPDELPAAGRHDGGPETPDPAEGPSSTVPEVERVSALPTDVPDPVLDGPWSQRRELLARQAWYEDLWTGRGSESFERYLVRMGAYESMVLDALEVRDLPEALRFLPIIESGYYPSAVSRAGAVGLWQLMPGTARDAGLTVTAVLDERRDPYRSTDVALTFMLELNNRFKSWPLTLSAYNGGPARVARLARRHAPGLEYGDSVYFMIRPYLPRETRDFIPKLMAAAALAAHPADHGFGDVQPLPSVTFDEVDVPDATSVDVLAAAAEADQEVVERLNPQLVRGFTPAGRETTVRIPEGRSATFAANYARIPPDERVTFLEHKVASGDTFWDLSRRYGVSLAVLEAANPRVRPDRLQIGQWVVVPRAPAPGTPRRVASATASGSTGGGSGASESVHVVRSGDTLWDIARSYNVGVGEIRRWNDLGDGDVIQPGDRLKVRQ